MIEKYNNLNTIGADETGVGDYLSPLVACAAYVKKENIKHLAKLKIQDSKKMSDLQIKKIAPEIKKIISYRVRHLTQRGYNQLNKSFNANELKMFLHMQAINDLEAQNIKVDLIIIDQFANTNSIQKYYKMWGKSKFNFKPFKNKVNLIEKAESKSLAVACASILARHALLEMLDKQNQKWNTKFPLGTNKIVENFIVNFVNQHGIEILQEVAKIKFKTTKKLFEGKL